MSDSLYMILEIVLKIVELLLCSITMILVVELATFVPILFSFYKEDCNETIGELIYYEESEGLPKAYWNFKNKEWEYRNKRYYSMVVNYIVNGKKYQNIEKIGKRGIMFRKK